MVWRFSSRAVGAAALLGAALLQGHARVDARALSARLADASLVAAIGAARVIEPRLTGGFAYAPWSPPAGSGTFPTARPSSRLLGAAAHLEKVAQADARPEHLRALGVAYLLLGRGDQAIDTLERALAAAPDDPRTLSDLAAALLSRSAASEDTLDAVRALTYAERAWDRAPELAEAAFNAALARERMHLRSQARDAWRTLQTLEQRLDHAGGWGAEANRRVTALSSETLAQTWPRVKEELTRAVAAGTPIDASDLTRRFPQAIREYLKDDLLPAWGAAQLARGDAAAATAGDRRLTSAEALCTALAAHGDATCRRSIARIIGAAPAERTDLAAGHHDFGDAMKLFREHQYRNSERLFTAARASFVRADGADSPDALWCDVYLAIGEYRAGRHAASSTRLRAALGRVTDRDTAIFGRIHWQLALNDVATEAFAAALEKYERARAAFAAIREPENVARMDALFAEALSNLGSRREAWERYDRALGALDAAHNLAARQAILAATWIRALDQDFPEVALEASNEFLSSPQARSEPVAFMDALLTRFATLWRLGRQEAALDELRTARRTLADVRDASMRQRAEAEIDLREGRMFAASDPRRAVPLLTRAIDAFRAQDLSSRVPTPLRLRGQAYLGAGDAPAAERDFLEGVRALDTRAATMTDAPLSASAREQTWPLVTELIRIELSRGRPSHALMYAERAKRQGLPADRLRCGREGPSVDEDCWRAHLPAGLAAIYYVALERQLAIWVVRPSGITYVQQDITAARLRALASDYRRAIEDASPPARVDAIAASLYDQVIQPVAPLLDRNTDLLILPDDSLHGIPFAALRNSRRQRYLIEDHVVLVAPSYSHFLAESDASAIPVSTLSALVVTSPKTTGPISAALPRLPGAEDEARHMAATLRSVHVLKDADATKSRLRDALGDAGILHIASHARVNHRAPWRSYFVLAPDAGRAGEELLFMWELSSLPLHHLRLAVLAACSSADGPVAGSGGALSLAHPFLAAGVPHVIASLWPVNDRAARLLFGTFYDQLARGALPEDALRAAQLEMLRGPSPELRHPSSWAPFVAIGGRHLSPVMKRGTT